MFCSIIIVKFHQHLQLCNRESNKNTTDQLFLQQSWSQAPELLSHN